MNSKTSRRTFVKNMALTGSMLPFLSKDLMAQNGPTLAPMPRINIFSKHLQFLNYQDMAQVARELGFDGVDLTIRPKGHVEPERVEDDLPKAVEAMKMAGMKPSMFCTAVEDARNPVDKKLLETAAKLGFEYYRMNWYRYQGENKSIPQFLDEYRDKIAGLSQLNKKHNLVGCYQNHAGRWCGATMFEIWEVLKKADPKHMGVQYDLRHATVEGGLSWQTGLELIKPQIKTIVVKDTIWEKKNGKMVANNVPLGQGMADFDTYFKILKKANIQVPISLHLEYDLGGANHGATTLSVDKQIVYDAMKRDLLKTKELWERA
ncbi:sugar phosphate isomerase/epimerase family protein [Dyadobacter tibetensis]|uniref:sugar phosphate isomerase/epimerase family protein n=1 Tax=Dyadobacter tibetensis TaxID=1211851 RepID=UPI00047199EE|nr:sugar phosphate isomerase/epimerase family protein [Dyadobacter tibetensis]